MSISVDRRIDIFKRPVRYLLVAEQDVPAALRLLARHGEQSAAEPAGAYAPAGAHRIHVDDVELEVALRLISTGGPGALSHIEALGCPLDAVTVEYRQPVTGGATTTTLYVDGEQAWTVAGQGVAA